MKIYLSNKYIHTLYLGNRYKYKINYTTLPLTSRFESLGGFLVNMREEIVGQSIELYLNKTEYNIIVKQKMFDITTPLFESVYKLKSLINELNIKTICLK